jgi:glycerol-3-phosphate dehydrogenase
MLIFSPVIEAEVRYAIRHEYAQTAVDVIARRCRLSFLNAQAALNALPRVVEIMAEDLHWNHRRQRDEIERATKFLASMGLPPGIAPPAVKSDSRSFLERLERIFGFSSVATRKLRDAPDMVYSRAQFETGEIETLRQAFMSKAKIVVTAAGNQEQLCKIDLIELVMTLPGYQGVTRQNYDYVFAETGFTQKDDLSFDEFVEVRDFLVNRQGLVADAITLQVCAELRDIVFAPVSGTLKRNRLRIPVEKSGGGV